MDTLDTVDIMDTPDTVDTADIMDTVPVFHAPTAVSRATPPSSMRVQCAAKLIDCARSSEYSVYSPVSVSPLCHPAEIMSKMYLDTNFVHITYDGTTHYP